MVRCGELLLSVGFLNGYCERLEAINREYKGVSLQAYKSEPTYVAFKKM